MKKSFLTLASGISMMTLLTISCSSGDQKGPENGSLKKENMDLTVSPGDDFYKYVGGTWMKNNPIPEEYSRYSSMEILANQNMEQQKALLEEAAKNQSSETAKKIGILYALGSDTAKIDKEGITPILPYLDIVNTLKTNADLPVVLAKLNKIAIYPFFYLFSSPDDNNAEMEIAQTYQAGLSLPDRDYYLVENPQFKTIQDEYKKYLTNMCAYLPQKNEKATDIIYALETEIAKISMDRNNLRNPGLNNNVMEIAKLKEIAPEFNWDAYLAEMGISDLPKINIRQVEFTKSLVKLLKTTSVENLKIFIQYNILSSLSGYLSSDIEKTNFAFFGGILSGKTKMHERWKRVLNVINESMGEELGKLYVEKYFPAEAKTRMEGLVVNLKESLKESITNLKWMSEPTKKEALAKLEKMRLKIGYPSKWEDYTNLKIENDSYVANVIRSREFAVKKELAKFNKPVDKEKWGMTPQTVNAYYHPNLNEIVFPAAILQPPFFNMSDDDAVNYGAIGVIIGHEMTHGFDDQGSQFDKDGNIKEWWTNEDKENFKKQYTPLVTFFGNYSVLDTLKINGEMTVGENIADLGGVTIALNAFKKTEFAKTEKTIDGFNPLQRFFISYGNVWIQNIRNQELAQRVQTDVHSPGEARVNGIVYQISDFYTAFNISDKAKRFIPEPDRIKIW